MTGPEIWLAPLHGITDAHFRKTLCRHFGGIDFFMSPFLAIQSKGRFNKRVWTDIFPENNDGMHLVPQLMGNDPQGFVDTMLFLNDNFGYERFNINLGCPSSKVVRHHRGCALLTDVCKIENIVKKITSETDFKLSLKMRLGLKDEEEGVEVITMLDDYPLDFVVLHPRLGVELYEGSPDLAAFGRFCDITHHKVVYSGDLFSVDDYRRVSASFPKVDAWMLGRGLLRNPFLAEEIKGEDRTDKINIFFKYYCEYVEGGLSVRGEQGALARLKELWHYYSFFFQLSCEELQSLLRIKDFLTFFEQTKKLINRNNSCV